MSPSSSNYILTARGHGVHVPRIYEHIIIYLVFQLHEFTRISKYRYDDIKAIAEMLRWQNIEPAYYFFLNLFFSTVCYMCVPVTCVPLSTTLAQH